MTIQVLVCRADGTQEIETREVPDGFYPQTNATAVAAEDDDSPQPLTDDELPFE